MAHPQANDEVKAIDKQIIEAFKAKVDQTSGKWVDELPKIL